MSRTSKALNGDAVSIVYLRLKVNNWRRKHPNVKLRDVCRYYGAHPKYISNRMSDPRQQFVQKETYDKIINMLEGYKEK